MSPEEQVEEQGPPPQVRAREIDTDGKWVVELTFVFEESDFDPTGFLEHLAKAGLSNYKIGKMTNSRLSDEGAPP